MAHTIDAMNAGANETPSVVTRRDMPGGWKIRWNETLANRWRSEGNWLDTTLAEITTKLAIKEPDRILIVEGERNFSATAVMDEARQLASALIRRGLRPGDVVSYQIPNWYEGCVINLAASLAGLVVNPLVPIYRETELRFMLSDIGARIVFVPEIFRSHDYAAMYRHLAADLDQPFEIVVLRGNSSNALRYEDLVAGGDPDDLFPKVDPDSVYVVMHTSGTTGRPKCVVHSHNSFMVQGKVHAQTFHDRDDEVDLVATPISHIAGIIIANLAPAVAKAKVVLMDTWDPKLAVDLIERHSANSCGGATPFLQGILEVARHRGTHLPSLTRAGTGGAAVPADLMEQVHAWFPNVNAYRVYGCTEVPTITSGVSDRSMIAQGAHTDGEIRHTDIRIVDATGHLVGDGEDGEVLVRGPAMMLGYLRDEDNEDAFDAAGFFRTGDLGRRIETRYLLITGRKKDLIIRNGENLSPKEIEDALFDHPDIAAVAVVGMPSVRTGEAVCAFVVARGNSRPDLASIASHLVSRGLARQKIPAHVELVDLLPLSPQGKVMKPILRQHALLLAGNV